MNAVELLPHRPPLVLITKGVAIADGEAEAIADTSENCIFFEHSLGGVPACAALEYMAQTMAFAVGDHARRAGEPPKPGFILGSRHFEVRIPVFRRDEVYRVHVHCDYTDEQFAAFDCKIADASGNIVAEGVLTAFQPDMEELDK